jgi:hypothetical protein
MRIASSPTLRIATGLLLAVLLSVVGYQVVRRLNSHGPEALLKRADEMSWLNSWIAPEPLYRKAEIEFEQRHQPSKALYARVSQMPAHSESSTSIPSQIALLRRDLDLPEAREPETRLRILTILGMLRNELRRRDGAPDLGRGRVSGDPAAPSPACFASGRRAGIRCVPARRHRNSKEGCRSGRGRSRRLPTRLLISDTQACTARVWWNCTNTKRPSDRSMKRSGLLRRLAEPHIRRSPSTQRSRR